MIDHCLSRSNYNVETNAAVTSHSSDIKKESQAYNSGVLGPAVAQEGNEWEPGHSYTEEMCKRDAEERVGNAQGKDQEKNGLPG